MAASMKTYQLICHVCRKRFSKQAHFLSSAMSMIGDDGISYLALSCGDHPRWQVAEALRMTKKAPITALNFPPRPEIAMRVAAEQLSNIAILVGDGIAVRTAVRGIMFSEARGGLAVSVDAAIHFKRILSEAQAAFDQQLAQMHGESSCHS